MIRPAAERKFLCNSLAELFATQQGSEILAILAKFESPHDRLPERMLVKPIDFNVPPTVGIWEPQSKNGVLSFIRSRDIEPWSMWANVGQIKPKSNKRRVVLMGESVARGYFYDPYFSPASALESFLKFAANENNIEVVDLARTDMSLEGLLEIAGSARILEPDAYVFFAGNNWRPFRLSRPEDLNEISRLLKTNPKDQMVWSRLRGYVEAVLKERVSLFFSRLSEIASSSHIPMVFVVPEFNLLDWKDVSGGPLLTDGAATLHWLRLRKAAEDALGLRQFAKAASLAMELLELDAGSTPVGFQILGQCQYEEGDKQEARVSLEAARDTSLCWPQEQSPRCYSVVQDTVRREAVAARISVVDLPHVFNEFLDGDLPGRRLFHDYCHLTCEGISVAMAAVTEALLPLLSFPGRPWVSVLQRAGRVEPKAAAEAHFLSAVHNANWGQPLDIVQYHCDKAIEEFVDVRIMMSLFVDFHLRHLPSALCGSFEEMTRLQSLSAVNLFFNPWRPLEEKFINLALVQTITKTLEAIQPDLTESASKLLKQEHRLEDSAKDLLNSLYSGGSHLNASSRPYGYYKSYREQSQFLFVCDKPAILKISLTHRIPWSTEEQEIEIKINKHRVNCVSASSRWQTTEITISEKYVNDGANILLILWPPPDWNKPRWEARVIAECEDGIIPNVQPIYGEIHTLRAQLAREEGITHL
jgi:hypothetical protein